MKTMYVSVSLSIRQHKNIAKINAGHKHCTAMDILNNITAAWPKSYFLG